MPKRKRGSDAWAVPAKKKKRAPPVYYDCLTCGDSKPEKQFPDYNPSAECEHSMHTCRACLRKYVDVQMESANTTISGANNKTFGIQCPECPSIMSAVNIEIATTQTMYAQFDKLERLYIASITRWWRSCLSTRCDAGQVHVSASNDPRRAKADDEPNVTDICQCYKCGARACVPCDRPYHVGESCEEYRLRNKDRIEEDDESLQTIEHTTRACPTCGVRVVKVGGCDSMTCPSCKGYFVWHALLTRRYLQVQ